MTDAQWEAADDHVLTVFLNGDFVEIGRRGERIVDDRLLIVLNGDPEQCEVVLPPPPYAERWSLDLDTHAGTVGEAADAGEPLKAGATLEVPGRTVLVLRAADG